MKRLISLLTVVTRFPLMLSAQEPPKPAEAQYATIRLLTLDEQALIGVELCASRTIVTETHHRHWFWRGPVKVASLVRNLTKKIAG